MPPAALCERGSHDPVPITAWHTQRPQPVQLEADYHHPPYQPDCSACSTAPASATSTCLQLVVVRAGSRPVCSATVGSMDAVLPRYCNSAPGAWQSRASAPPCHCSPEGRRSEPQPQARQAQPPRPRSMGPTAMAAAAHWRHHQLQPVQCMQSCVCAPRRQQLPGSSPLSWMAAGNYLALACRLLRPATSVRLVKF
jgi:hypothetical protein